LFTGLKHFYNESAYIMESSWRRGSCDNYYFIDGDIWNMNVQRDNIYHSRVHDLRFVVMKIDDKKLYYDIFINLTHSFEENLLLVFIKFKKIVLFD